ncbi:hypothetical protein U1Q18_025125 [Sarracenia purpurea var. burkii]
MVKKRVPDWLNSSLWSTTPPPAAPPDDDPRPGRDTGKSNPPSTSTIPSTSSKSAATSAPADFPALQPVPVPPPPFARPEPPKLDIRDPLSSGSDNGCVGSPSAEDISLQTQLVQELSRKVINMGELRRLASQGVPDGAGIRCTVWKLLLGYLPTDRGHWSSELAKKRSQYKHFKEELLMNPSEITRRLEKSTSLENKESKCETGGALSRSEVTHGEHPLSLGQTSIWNQFFQDTEIIEQIDRDVKRTHPDMHFFSGDSQFAKTNQEALKTILIVFAKLNPGIRYVQGMNEILAPLFYVFRNDPNEENATYLACWLLSLLSSCPFGVREKEEQLGFKRRADNGAGWLLDKDRVPRTMCGLHKVGLEMIGSYVKVLQAFAEADTFFCFVELLSGFRDHFCQQLDNSVVGIRSTITKLSRLLKEHDEELWRHLEVTTKEDYKSQPWGCVR